jgi:hypothetical protein
MALMLCHGYDDSFGWMTSGNVMPTKTQSSADGLETKLTFEAVLDALADRVSGTPRRRWTSG